MSDSWVRHIFARKAFKSCVIVATALFLFSFFALPALCDPGDMIIGVEDGWIWQVVLLPPDEGWESDSGRSALAAVRLAEWEVMDSADGVSGRDIRFHQEPPVDVETAAERVAEWRERSISAVLSFSRGDDIEILRPFLSGAGPILLSAYGESANIYDEEGVPDPMIFALDLFRDFRVSAFAAYASEVLKAGDVVALMADRLDPMLESYSRHLGDMLSDSGFDSERFWIPGGGMDSFRMIESEAVSSGADVMVTWAGSMVVRDVWRAARRMSKGFEIWYGGAPHRILLPFDGVLVADQDYPVRADETLSGLRKEIRRRLNIVIKDDAAAGRAYVTCEWLFDAFRRAASPVPSVLAGVMPEVAGLFLGTQRISVNPATHRPLERRVAFMTVVERSFHPVSTLTIRGPDYLP